ncbi:MAG: glycoside hydrolase family 13 protein [Streptococcaceae bacterium]|nr:glycoside hydrolase family 13 protein [Streptococcaceae bacterium]
MNPATFYHRPESEYAYVNDKGTVNLRLRVGRDQVQKVDLFFGDPYYYEKETNSDKWVWGASPKAMRQVLSTDDFDYFEVEVDVETKRLDYAFVLYGEDEEQNEEKLIYCDKGCFPFSEKLLHKTHTAFRLPFFHEIDRYKAPKWVSNTVWYQIFPERFANGERTNDPVGIKKWNSTKRPEPDDRFGGDLQGVLDHMDYLSDLGINGIYFTPIFKAPSNHKYDTEDYFEIDPDFGDKAIFKKVVDEAHKRGIRIMLDAVFNHMGADSPQWQDVLKNQEKSKYADWFHVNDWPATFVETDNYPKSSYATFAYVPYMPKLNTANPEVQEHLLSIAEYWIREFDIDAWRLDVADEVDHQFWKLFRKRCDTIKKDFYIVGEVWQSAQTWLNGDEFSGVMNYSTTFAVLDGLAKKEISLSKMVSEINSQLMLYRRTTWPAMFNCLDSHDTPRTLFECGEDKAVLKQVEALTYMQAGAPCIFYGDEQGLTGGEEPDCRRPMAWQADEQDEDLYDFFKKLIHFRLENAETLSQSDFTWEVDEEAGVVKLARANIRAVFNSGEGPIIYSQDNILISNLANDKEILPKGFIIYKK